MADGRYVLVTAPRSPLPVGKKLECPRCARTIVVPSPVDEELEEVEPAPKRSSARRDDDEEEEERPSRRSRRDEGEEEERPQKRRKRAKGGGSGLKIAALVGVALLFILGVGVGGYFLFGPKLGSSANSQARSRNDVASTLATVTDEASAKAAQPRLVSLGGQLRAHYEKAKAVMKGPGTKEYDEILADAYRSPAKYRAFIEKMEKDKEEGAFAFRRMIVELARVNKIPGGKPLIDAFYEAWGEGSSVAKLGMLGAAFQQPDFQQPNSQQMDKDARDVQNKKRTRENYDKVQLGMGFFQVRDLLNPGDTENVEAFGIVKARYPAPLGTITFKQGVVIAKTPWATGPRSSR